MGGITGSGKSSVRGSEHYRDNSNWEKEPASDLGGKEVRECLARNKKEIKPHGNE